MGSRWPRVKTGKRLSRIWRGESHALIGGKLVRGLATVSSGRNRQLQKQGQVHSRWTASTEGQEAHRQPQRSGEGRRKRRTQVNFVQKNARRRQRVNRGAEKRERGDQEEKQTNQGEWSWRKELRGGTATLKEAVFNAEAAKPNCQKKNSPKNSPLKNQPNADWYSN